MAALSDERLLAMTKPELVQLRKRISARITTLTDQDVYIPRMRREVEQKGWSVQERDLGFIDGYRMYQLNVDVDEIYDDHCLLHYAHSKDAWFLELFADDSFCFERDPEEHVADVFLYFASDAKAPPAGSRFRTIEQDGTVQEWDVTDLEVRSIDGTLKVAVPEWSHRSWCITNIVKQKTTKSRRKARK